MYTSHQKLEKSGPENLADASYLGTQHDQETTSYGIQNNIRLS